MLRRETFLTPQGLKQLQEELDDLKGVRLKEVSDRVRKASESGGNVDNAEYDEAMSQQGFVEGRIRELESIIINAVVTAHDKRGGIVDIGSAVTVQGADGRKQSYKLVGSAEASPLAGKISNESPVGRALLGHKVGDEVEVETASKKPVKFTITRIR